MPQPSHISKLPVPPERGLAPDLRRYFGICRDRLGFVPNVLAALSAKPTRLRNFITVYNEIMLGDDSRLTRLEREMIAVVVSSHNRCYYCLVAHGQAVRELSGDPELGELLVMNYRLADLPPRQRAMLDFAWKLTATPEAVGDADRTALRKAGFAAGDIFDICEITALFNLSNRMAMGLDMMPNREYHAMSREPWGGRGFSPDRKSRLKPLPQKPLPQGAKRQARRRRRAED
jgi:uncharacterized peroxidase-related enzyme